MPDLVHNDEQIEEEENLEANEDDAGDVEEHGISNQEPRKIGKQLDRINPIPNETHKSS
jgi:hypothetical protein